MATYLYAVGVFLLTIAVGLFLFPDYFISAWHTDPPHGFFDFINKMGSALGFSIFIYYGPYFFGSIGLLFLLGGRTTDKKERLNKN